MYIDLWTSSEFTDLLIGLVLAGEAASAEPHGPAAVGEAAACQAQQLAGDRESQGGSGSTEAEAAAAKGARQPAAGAVDRMAQWISRPDAHTAQAVMNGAAAELHLDSYKCPTICDCCFVS